MDSDMKSIKSHFFAGRFISKKPVETRLEFVFGLETRMDTGREQWFSLAENVLCRGKKGGRPALGDGSEREDAWCSGLCWTLSATSWAYDVGAWIEPKPAAMGWWQVRHLFIVCGRFCDAGEGRGTSLLGCLPRRIAAQWP